MSTPAVIIGTPVTVASLPTATVPAVDDYAILDGVANGTRKILATSLDGALPLRADEVPSIMDFPVAVQTRIAELSSGELLMLLVAKGIFTPTELNALTEL